MRGCGCLSALDPSRHTGARTSSGRGSRTGSGGPYWTECEGVGCGLAACERGPPSLQQAKGLSGRAPTHQADKAPGCASRHGRGHLALRLTDLCHQLESEPRAVSNTAQHR